MTGIAILSVLLQTATLTPATERNVYVTQVGDSNDATVAQGADRGSVRVEQRGSHNVAQVVQAPDTSRGLAAIGTAAVPLVAIADDSGSSIAILQMGGGNHADVRQFNTDGSINVAALMQSGTDNRMRLDQTGFGNHAELEQTGDGNAMTATQLAGANALRWRQIGDGMPDLNVQQTGGQTVDIVQQGYDR